MRRIDCPVALACCSSRYHRYSNENAMTLCLSFPFALPPLLPALPFLRTSYDPACWVGECAGGCDDCVAGVVAWLLARGQVADAVSSISSRLTGRGANRICPSVPSWLAAPCSSRRPVLLARLMSLAYCFDELPPRVSYSLSPIMRLALRLVSHLVVRLVTIALPSMCFSCVFFIPFSGGMCLLDLSPRPSRSGVSLSRLAVRLGRRRIVMCCLLDLPRWRSSHLVLSPRRVGREAGRDGEIS